MCHDRPKSCFAHRDVKMELGGRVEGEVHAGVSDGTLLMGVGGHD